MEDVSIRVRRSILKVCLLLSVLQICIDRKGLVALQEAHATGESAQPQARLKSCPFISLALPIDTATLLEFPCEAAYGTRASRLLVGAHTDYSLNKQLQLNSRSNDDDSIPACWRCNFYSVFASLLPVFQGYHQLFTRPLPSIAGLLPMIFYSSIGLIN
jgi:hypothetical protein